MALRLFGVWLLFFSPVAAFAAEIMFEGYYRVELAGQHVGYAIVRYEYEPKDHQFRQISFLRTNAGGKVGQESLRAVANDKLQPVSFNYTLQDDKVVKTIDGTFKGEIMDLKIADGKKLLTQKHKIPKGTFFSSFLNYLMLQKPLPVNTAFTYSAVAEEEGASYNGKALIESKETRAGFEILKIVNTFKGDRYISRMAVVKDPKDPNKNIKGEILSSVSPVKTVSTELVANPAEATQGQLVPNKILITLFGNMPTGKANLLAQATEKPETAAAKPAAEPGTTLLTTEPEETPKKKPGK